MQTGASTHALAITIIYIYILKLAIDHHSSRQEKKNGVGYN